MKKIATLLIRIYKLFFSFVLRVLFGGGCRFLPTCSDYSREAIEKFGVIKGTKLSLGRLLRCHPFSRGNFDPVPTK